MDIGGLNFRPGDILKAEQLQTIVDEINDPSADVRGGPGLSVRRGPRGQLQLSGLQPGKSYLCVANGNISPRSGSTPGTGKITIYRYDGSALFSAGIDLDVLNASSGAMTSGHGIDSGQYCWAQEDDDGWLWVSPLECS